MKYGFYEYDITPPIGSIIPGAFGARYADEILDKLYARAVVVNNGEKVLAIVVIDACGITLDITESIRNRVATLTPINPQDIMVMATHSHGGGPTLNWGEEVVTDENYLRTLAERASDAIYMAYRNCKESEAYIGSEDLFDISFIRVYEMMDGSLRTNPGFENADKILKPTAEIDPEVIVLAVKQNGNFVGAIVNFANHPATVATTQVTGDYISILAKELKKTYGEEFVTVFINGACGNINHINPFDESSIAPDRYEFVGKKIAESVVSVISKAKVMTNSSLASSSDFINARLRKPTPEQLLNAKEVMESFGDNLIDCLPKNDTPNYTEFFFALQAFIISADKRTLREIFIQTFRIGDIFIAGTPAQLFVQFGKKIKASTNSYCMVSAFANDYIGYVPTPECMREGVYEARLAPTSALAPESGDLIADKAIEHIKKM